MYQTFITELKKKCEEIAMQEVDIEMAVEGARRRADSVWHASRCYEDISEITSSGKNS